MTEATGLTESKSRNSARQWLASHAVEVTVAAVALALVTLVIQPKLSFSPSPPNYATILVHYGTNRKATGSTEWADYYGSERGDLQYGTCSVSIPRDHRMGEIERPSFWRLEFREDPEHHVVLLNVKPTTGNDPFFTSLKAKMAETKNSETFVFIHGFKTTFEESAHRTAQLTYDLGIELPIMFSWPTKGELSVSAYRHDETNEEWMRKDLAHFLHDVVHRSGARELHVIAHSMGNKGLSYALKEMRNGLSQSPLGKFRQIVLAAPDIDSDVFKEQIAPAIIGMSERTTLYASADDKALAFSKRIHGDYPRAGYVSGGVIVAPGIDTVDVSAVDASFVGHGYYGDSDTVMSDLYYLLREGLSPAERVRLTGVPSDEAPRYWRFRP